MHAYVSQASRIFLLCWTQTNPAGGKRASFLLVRCSAAVIAREITTGATSFGHHCLVWKDGTVTGSGWSGSLFQQPGLTAEPPKTPAVLLAQTPAVRGMYCPAGWTATWHIWPKQSMWTSLTLQLYYVSSPLLCLWSRPSIFVDSLSFDQSIVSLSISPFLLSSSCNIYQLYPSHRNQSISCGSIPINTTSLIFNTYLSAFISKTSFSCSIDRSYSIKLSDLKSLTIFKTCR